MPFSRSLSSIHGSVKEVEQVGPLGRRTPRNIANMDQTSLPFTFSSGETYTNTGERSVWVSGRASGLDEHHVLFS